MFTGKKKKKKVGEHVGIYKAKKKEIAGMCKYSHGNNLFTRK